MARIVDSEGNTIGRSVITVYSGDLILDKLRERLKTSGYEVKRVWKIPENSENGIDISEISSDIEHSSGLMTLSARCKLRVKLDHWRKGVKSSREYTSVVSDYSINDDGNILFNIMDKAVEDIAGQVLPLNP